MNAVPWKAMLGGVLLIGSTASAAVSPAWDQAEVVNIELSNFAFAPSALHLHPGHVYRLHFINKGSGGHNYSAPKFFAAAQIDPRDLVGLKKGAVELGKGEARDIRLVASAGKYDVKCTHFLHAGFGMKGSITVD